MRVFQLGKNQKGKWASVRFWKIRFDYVATNDGFKLLQFGGNPVKFIAHIPETASMPKYMMSTAWCTRRIIKNFRLGTTKKPVNLTSLWSIKNENVSSREQFTRLGMQFRARNYGDQQPGRVTLGHDRVHQSAVSEVQDHCTT